MGQLQLTIVEHSEMQALYTWEHKIQVVERLFELAAGERERWQILGKRQYRRFIANYYIIEVCIETIEKYYVTWQLNYYVFNDV